MHIDAGPEHDKIPGSKPVEDQASHFLHSALGWVIAVNLWIINKSVVNVGYWEVTWQVSDLTVYIWVDKVSDVHIP